MLDYDMMDYIPQGIMMDYILIVVILIMFVVGIVCNSLVLHTFRSLTSCNGKVLFSHLCVTDILTELSQVTEFLQTTGTIILDVIDVKVFRKHNFCNR